MQTWIVYFLFSVQPLYTNFKKTLKKLTSTQRNSNPRPLDHEACALPLRYSHCPSGFPIIIGCLGSSFCFKMNGCNKFGENWHFCIFCRNLKCKRSQRFKRSIFAKSCLENIFRPPLNLKPQKSYLRPQGRVALLLNGSRYLASDLVREESVMTGDLKF